jgi:hypothetical protein
MAGRLVTGHPHQALMDRAANDDANAPGQPRSARSLCRQRILQRHDHGARPTGSGVRPTAARRHGPGRSPTDSPGQSGSATGSAARRGATPRCGTSTTSRPIKDGGPTSKTNGARPDRVLQPRQTRSRLSTPGSGQDDDTRWRPPPIPATPTDPEPPPGGQQHPPLPTTGSTSCSAPSSGSPPERPRCRRPRLASDPWQPCCPSCW